MKAKISVLMLGRDFDALLMMNFLALKVRETIAILIFPNLATPAMFSNCIPFRLLGKLLLIEATVNGQEGYYILDTGTSDVLLNDKYFNSTNRRIELFGINGSTMSAQSINTSLEIAGHKWKNICAQIISMKLLEGIRGTPIAGLLGCNLFRNHEMVIDFQLKEIRLYPSVIETKGKSIMVDTSLEVCAFNYRGDGPSIYVEIDGNYLKLLIDTGSELNVLRKDLKRKLQSNLNGPHEKRIIGLGTISASTEVSDLSNITISNYHCNPMKTYFASLEHFNGHCSGGRVDGVLGHEFLKQFILVINFKKRVIYLYEYAKKVNFHYSS